MPEGANAQAFNHHWWIAMRLLHDLDHRPRLGNSFDLPGTFVTWGWMMGCYHRKQKILVNQGLTRIFGGSCEIRTHGGLTSSPVFKTGALNRSAKLPEGRILTGLQQAFGFDEGNYRFQTVLRLQIGHDKRL